jgi:DNA-binding transcriptional ArsR family regulator
MDETEQITRLCRALAVGTRVQILGHLRGGALCVGALAARLNVTQSAVSQHLRILRDADLVSPERRGYFIHYHVNETAVLDCIEIFRMQLLGSAESCHNEANRKGGEKPCARRKASAKSQRI